MTFEIFDAQRTARRDTLIGLTASPLEAPRDIAKLRAALGIESVAFGIITTLGKLYKMKTEADAVDREARALEEIADRIGQIDTRLTAMQDDLDQIKTSLAQLQVALDAVPAQVALSNLRGRISFVTDNIDRWYRLPTDTDNREQINKTYVDISTELRALMNHGFAHCADVLTGFLFELDLAILLNLRAKDIGRSVTRILRYLDMSFDAAGDGTIKRSLLLVQQDIAQIRKKDAALPKGVRHLVDIITTNDCPDSFIMIDYYYCVLEGDLDNGYAIKDVRESVPIVCNSRGSRRGRFEHALAEKSSDCGCGAAQSESLATPERAGCPVSMSVLRDLHSRYQDLLRKEAFLVDLIDKLGELRSAVEERFAWHEAFYG
jgi:hypothetical protein